jgi:uncharacterized protein
MEENKVLSDSERTWAMLCHLTALSGFIIPFGGIIGPFICWQSRRYDSPWINLNGKASLNFQLSMLLYIVLAIPLCFIIIGIPIIIVLVILKIIFVIIASVRASAGEFIKYPLVIPFIQ